MFAITLTIVLWNIYSFLCPFWSLSAQLTLIIYGGKKAVQTFCKTSNCVVHESKTGLEQHEEEKIINTIPLTQWDKHHRSLNPSRKAEMLNTLDWITKTGSKQQVSSHNSSGHKKAAWFIFNGKLASEILYFTYQQQTTECPS